MVPNHLFYTAHNLNKVDESLCMCLNVCVCVYMCVILTLFLSRQYDEQKVWSEDHSSLQAKRQEVKRHWGEETRHPQMVWCVCVWGEWMDGIYRPRKCLVGRQITCREDNFQIRKTLHDEKKDVREWTQQKNDRKDGNKWKKGSFSKMKFIVLGGFASNHDPVTPLHHYFVPYFFPAPFFLHLSFYAAAKSLGV